MHVWPNRTDSKGAAWGSTLASVEADSETPMNYHFLSPDGFVSPANWNPDVLTLPFKVAACSACAARFTPCCSSVPAQNALSLTVVIRLLTWGSETDPTMVRGSTFHQGGCSCEPHTPPDGAVLSKLSISSFRLQDSTAFLWLHKQQIDNSCIGTSLLVFGCSLVSSCKV